MPDIFTRRTALAAALALPLAGLSGMAAAETRSYVLTTATTGGTYYPVGVALATLAKIHLETDHGIDMAAIASAGSAENTVMMRDGEAQFAIMQGLFGHWARDGSGALSDLGPQDNMRSIAMLWPNTEHFLINSTLAETGTVDDLENLAGHRFAIGALHSGTEHSNRFLLSNFGLDYESWDLVHEGFGPTIDLLIDGNVMGTIIGSGIGVGAVNRAAMQMEGRLTLLSVTEDQAERLDGGSGLYFTVTIPGGTYPGIDDDRQTVAQPNFLAVNDDVPEEDVYLITRTIYENLGFLCNIHPAACDITVEDALTGLPLPLHAGAARYFREVGMTIPDTIAPVD